MTRRTPFFLLSILVLGAGACSRTGAPASASAPAPKARLISASSTMATAAEFPRNPLTDTSLDDSPLSRDIKWGFQIFTDTPGQAPQFSPGRMTCNNCHMNGGQRERSLPLVGIAAIFPEYNRRDARVFTLADRIVGCFYRSQNATGAAGGEGQPALPTPTSKEVIALSAYLTWLSNGFEIGGNLLWRGQNAIAQANRVPLEKLNPERGAALFKQHCISCHGEDGQGVAIADKKPGPLWGPDSWNDGAGAARVYTLAGMIRYSMPYVSPGVLTDEEAQQVAAFINSKPRPSFPFKDADFRVEKLPADSVYYPKR